MIILALIVLLLVGAVVVYNRLVQGQIMVQEAWSGIDVQLKRRHDLIPNLVEAVKGYMAHEQNVLEEVTRLRGEAGAVSEPQDRSRIENNITKGLKTIFAVAEAYPDLKADRSFLNLQKSLTEIENDVQLARRYYNGTVRNQNILVASFPSNLIAGVFAFERQDFFELSSSTERAVPQVDLSNKEQNQ